MLARRVAESDVVHTPPTTVLSLPSGLSSLLLLETFPGQEMGRPSNGSPCEASNTSNATACCGCGLGSVPLEAFRRRNHGFTAMYDMSPVAPSRFPSHAIQVLSSLARFGRRAASRCR